METEEANETDMEQGKQQMVSGLLLLEKNNNTDKKLNQLNRSLKHPLATKYSGLHYTTIPHPFQSLHNLS